jgi:ABC-type glycerol-3-phosphate transport system substrate-binding protein
MTEPRLSPILARRSLFGLIGAGAVTLLAACGGAAPASPAAPTTAAKPADASKPADTSKPADASKAAAPAASGAGRTKIRFVMSNNQDAIKRWLEPMTKAFEEKHPTIQLEHITTPTTDESTQKILAMFAANDPGEVLNLPATRDYKRVAVRKVLLDLEPLAKRDNFDLNVFAPVTRDLHVYCGKWYGFPMHLSFYVTMYNKKLFQEAGVKLPDEYHKEGRWKMGGADDGYLDAALKLTRGEGDKRVWADGRIISLHVVNYFIFSWGGKIYNEDRTKFVIPDDPKSLEALQYQVDLVLKHKVYPTVDEARGLGDLFLAGRRAMVRTGHNQAAQIQAALEAGKVDPGMTFAAAGPAGLVPREGPDAISMPANGKSRDQAWAFTSWTVSKEGMEYYTRGGRGASPRLDQLQDPAYVKLFFPWEKPEVFLESVKMARTDVAVSQSEATSIFDREMDLAYLGKKTVAEAMKTAKAEIDPLLEGGERCS